MSTVKLYKSAKIIPEKNFKVDSLETYLATLTYEELKKFQYIKHALAVDIVINKSQSLLNFFDEVNNYNYVSIQNTTDSYPVYYFILAKYWSSTESVRLTLKLDTVNTFTTERGSIVFSDRTLVTREHKDRLKMREFTPRLMSFSDRDGSVEPYGPEEFSLIQEYEIPELAGFSMVDISDIELDSTQGEIVDSFYTYHVATQTLRIEVVVRYPIQPDEIFGHFTLEASGTNTILRKIDLYTEGITPVLFKKNIGDIIEKVSDIPLDIDWYLIYRNQNDPDESLTNPVDCFICASERIEIAYSGGSQVISPTDLEEGKFYYVLRPSRSAVIVNDITIRDAENNAYVTYYQPGSNITVIIFYRTGNKIRIKKSTKTNLSDALDYGVFHETAYISVVNNIPLPTRVSLDPLSNANEIDTPSLASDEVLTLGASSIEIDSVDDIDKTDAKLIKIIMLPYAPLGLTMSEGIIDFDRTKFEYDSTMNMIHLKRSAANGYKFDKVFTTLINPLSNLVLNRLPSELNTEMARSDEFESKLFHSDFYQNKFSYDSFGFVFQLERLPDTIPPADFRIEYVVTSTINSRLMFIFNDYITGELGKEDYDNVLPVARNNEVTLYNQQYINYLRVGYNYDVKSKQRSETGAILGTALSLIGSIASFASAGVTGGIGIASGIGFLTTTASQLASTVISINQSEQNLQAKQLQLQNQATSVAGSDDVDLMKKYCGNRLKAFNYHLSPKMKKALFDMFYFTGYIANEMKIPVFNTRTWFNFVACECQFESIRNIPDGCLDDLKERYKAGVTVMHYHNNKYDWNREFENFEVSLNIPDPVI